MEANRTMKLSDVETLFEDRLRVAGIDSYLDRHRSQFLDVGESFFVELVFTEGEKLATAQKVCRQVLEELKTSNVAVEIVVRVLWNVIPESIQYEGPSRGPSGGLRTALQFGASLRAGHYETRVSVAVTLAALDVVRQRLNIKAKVFGWAPEKGDVSEETLKTIVKSYLDLYLSYGGMSFWDPLTTPNIDLNEAAMSFLFKQSTKFVELLQAVKDAFDPIAVRRFLESFQILGLKASRFEAALTELSGFLGGAYKRGQTFSISATELYNDLGNAEQELIKGYYFRNLDRLKEETPELVREFRGVFE